MEDWEAFCEFLSNRQPPRSLSESTDEHAVEFLLSLPSHRINKVAGSLIAVTFKEMDGSHKENPFGSPLVRTFLKERVKEEKESGKKKLNYQSLPEGHESEIKGGHGDDDKVNLLEKYLTDSDVVRKQNCLVIATSYTEEDFLFASIVLGGTTRPLSFEDEDGKPWKINCTHVNQSYVFTEGWSSYVREKQLGAGDFVFFQRHRWDSSRLFIGCRRRDNNDAALEQRDNVFPDPTSLATPSVQGCFSLGQRDNVLPDPTSLATPSVQGCFSLGQRDNVLPDPTSPATSSVQGRSALGQRDYVLPDPTSSEMLRLPEHSNTGFDPILVIFCGDNQDSDETYFISYIFSELCLRGLTPLRYDLTRSTVTGDREMLYSCRVGIMIFSENYARSRECLDGFVAITDHLKANKLELIPVFFKTGNRLNILNQNPLGTFSPAVHSRRYRKQNCLVIATSYTEEDFLFASIVLGGTTRPLSFEDEDGKPWKINCTYVNRSYVFTEGWSSYVREKQLGAGDFVFFQRQRWDSSRLFIGCRRRDNGDAALEQRDNVLPDPTSLATSSVQGCSSLGQRDNVLPDPTSPATSSVQGRSAFGQRDYVLPDPTSSGLRRLPEHSNTGFDPILVIFCGDNQDAEETYFISYIFNELCLRGFTPLRYDLTRSTVTGDPEMLYHSRVGIMIFTENYARSTEYLDGFVAIMDHLKANKLELIPVFFKVSLFDVMNQSGSLERAFLELEKSILAPQVLKWKKAMIKLFSINGYHQYMKGHEVMLAKNIVRDVCLLLNSGTNGIKVALESILPLLDCSQPSAPHIVGLWGMAGIGKTTISREIFRRQAQRYDVCYFLQDFDLTCQTKGLSQLRDEFFSKIFGEENVFIDACDTKLSFTRDRFLGKRVLIILDGVSNARDAEVLIGGFGWLSGGHTIILTSRNRHVLVQCNSKELYEIPKLSNPYSFRLCFENATVGNWKEKMSLISVLVNYASGNPLALRVLGLSIQKQNIYNEKQHLIRLRQHPLIEIQDTFRRSFNVLDDNEKNIFLDLACFFRGENQDRVVNILDGCGFLTELGICGLIDECLISLVDNRIEMPNIFQDAGRFIVCQEDEDVGKRSRLWDTYDITDVLTNKIGTEAIEGIVFDMSRLTLELSSSVFEKMYRLRLLKLHCPISGSHCKVSLHQGLDSLPDELRLLHWERYPLGSLPRKFNPKNLVELNMPYSNMTKLWKGTKNLEKLKRIILSHSRQLTEFPRLSKAMNLEHIDLEGCTSLVKVNSSILHHHKLTFLSLKDCSHLRIMPTTVHLESLEVLNLSGCSELEDLQVFSPNLKELYLAGTGIKGIPSSIRDLTRLITFDLEGCNLLHHLPTEISNPKAVVTLSAKSSMDLSSVEDMAPPYKRYRLKRVIESVIQRLGKSKRGPRSRSSQYRGVTFYRRTGRWESHIWDCGKLVYLGGFDTAHAAARAYDRAAVKFRGLEADINFNIRDYEEDIKQMANLSKEEVVQVLRRQSSGFPRNNLRHQGVAMQKIGGWGAQIEQFHENM